MSFSRSARQPAITTPLTCPNRLRSIISSITPIDSCRALSMNPQVLTIIEVGRLGFGHDRVAALGEQSQHPFGIDEVLGTPQTDE